MVFGFSIAVTAVPSVYQCADMHRMALGFGIELPSRRQDSVYWLRSSVFIGLPWPKNTLGILELSRRVAVVLMRDRIARPRPLRLFPARSRRCWWLSARHRLRAVGRLPSAGRAPRVRRRVGSIAACGPHGLNRREARRTDACP